MLPVDAATVHVYGAMGKGAGHAGFTPNADVARDGLGSPAVGGKDLRGGG